MACSFVCNKTGWFSRLRLWLKNHSSMNEVEMCMKDWPTWSTGTWWAIRLRVCFTLFFYSFPIQLLLQTLLYCSLEHLICQGGINQIPLAYNELFTHKILCPCITLTNGFFGRSQLSSCSRGSHFSAVKKFHDFSMIIPGFLTANFENFFFMWPQHTFGSLCLHCRVSVCVWGGEIWNLRNFG